MYLYVYYRSPEHQVATTQVALQHFMQAVALETGIQGQLQRRPHAKEGQITWMECYAKVPEGFAVQLEAMWQKRHLSPLCSSPRFGELFMEANGKLPKPD